MNTELDLVPARLKADDLAKVASGAIAAFCPRSVRPGSRRPRRCEPSEVHQVTVRPLVQRTNGCSASSGPRPGSIRVIPGSPSSWRR
jgi:hypothetical protein